MNRETFLIILLIIGIIYVSYKIYLETDIFHLKCIESDVDGNKYCVRERNNYEEAADRLAKVTNKCKQFVKYMQKVNPDAEITKRLVDGFNPKQIQEVLPSSEHTAYSEDKGEKLAFCVNKTREGSEFIDHNTLMFVALHELSHIACDEVGHTEKYWRIFKEILEYAVDLGIYEPVDYKKNPVVYCSMEITDNPYFDL